MRKLMLVLMAVALLGLMAPAVHATVFDIPLSGDYALPELKFYTWGAPSGTTFSGQIIQSARLDITGIYNYTADDNVLYVHLLNTAAPGVTPFDDPSWEQGWPWGDGGNVESDNFSNGVNTPLLTQWNNLPTTPQNLYWNFTAAQLASLSAFVVDGNWGLGFDPDCEYGNQDIRLTVTTCPAVPEPCTMLLLGSGLLGLAGLKRRRG